jgi:urease accessory protein UreE
MRFATNDKKDTKMKANKQAELEKAGWKIGFRHLLLQ